MKYILSLLLVVMFTIPVFCETDKEAYEKAMAYYFSYNEKKQEEAFKIFKSLDYAPAYMKTLECYLFGIGTEKDIIKAHNRFKDAIEDLKDSYHTDLNAAYELGNAYVMNIGVKGKKSEGFLILFDAARKDHLYSMDAVAICHLQGIGTERNVSLAIPWLETATKKGSDSSRKELAQLYVRGIGLKKDVAKGLSLLEYGYNKHYPECTLTLGTLYYLGIGVKENNEKALFYFQKAADLGHPTAIYYLGRMYYEGLGTDKDTKKGIELLQIASKRKIEAADKYLEKIKEE